MNPGSAVDVPGFKIPITIAEHLAGIYQDLLQCNRARTEISFVMAYKSQIKSKLKNIALLP